MKSLPNDFKKYSLKTRKICRLKFSKYANFI